MSVLRQPRRLLLSFAPVWLVFLGWDVLAARAGQWRFDPRQVLAPRLLGLPVEEVLFFLVIPLCALSVWEAVRVVRRTG